jgi:hypothetical protein
MGDSYVTVQAQAPGITMGRPIAGNISDGSPTQDWQITLAAGDSLAVIVNTLNGDLDPTVALMGPSGDVIVENDDRLAGFVFDAGFDDVVAEQSGLYTIRVGRFSGSGDYRLWALPAYSHVWENETFEADFSRWQQTRFTIQQDGRMILETEPEFSIFVSPDGAVPVSNLYLQADFEWQSSREDTNATTGLQFRVQDDGTRRPDGYYFLIKPDGTWSFLKRDFEDFTVLQDDLPNNILLQDRITLGVWALNSRYRFYANGVLLGEITDDTFASGTWGLHIRGSNQIARVAVDDVLLTVPSRQQPNLPEHIATWDSPQPNDIITELQRLNILPEDGQRVFFLTAQNYDSGPRQIRTFLQETPQINHTNFVIGTDAFVIEGDNIGCGVTLRHQSEANQLLAFFDSDAGGGMINSINGETTTNVYDLLPEISLPISGQRIRLLLIVWDDFVTYYVNGQRFMTVTVPPRQGQLGPALLNYSTTAAACGYENLWVWQETGQ